jgi:hypothetical protein
MMITPWWQVLRLRPELGLNSGNINDVQMSVFRAVYSTPPAPYADPVYYGAITHPTATLVSLMARIAIRLGGGPRYTSTRALYHLDQGMGGGKSHGLIGLYHLAKHPDVFATTDIGQRALADAEERLGGVSPRLSGTHVVVLSADHMTPFAPDPRPEMDGPASTLWERFLWRLVDHDESLFRRYQPRWDQEGIKDALLSLERPILILVDEIMDYVRQLDDTKYEGVRNTELAFLKALFDAVNDVPHVAMVVVMVSTERDKANYGKIAQSFREELQANIVRNGMSTTVTEASDFSQIIRRRLFETLVSADVATATARALFTDIAPQWKMLVNHVPGASHADFSREVARSYPFHPDLLRLVETEWAMLAGYQHVRSTVMLFAQTAYIWMERAASSLWVPFLIGPGDLPLDQSIVREALLSSGIIENETTIANYRQVIANDIVSEGRLGGIAADLDRHYARKKDIWVEANPHAAQRMATALLLYSLAPRTGGRLGATEIEIKTASFVPDENYETADAETIFNDLKDAETGLATLHVMEGSPSQLTRYQLTTRQTLPMLFRSQRSAVSTQDCDSQIADVAEKLMRPGSGFVKQRFIKDELDSLGRTRPALDIFKDVDESNITRLIVLDPRRWTLLNGQDEETRRDIHIAFGIGRDALPVTHAASLVIACVNTQRRGVARERARDFLAWMRTAAIQVVKDDENFLAQSKKDLEAARIALEKEVKRAFQHYAYLIRNAQNTLEVRFAKFDDDSKSSLNSSNVWEQLVQDGRAIMPDKLHVRSLIFALKEELPRSLAEVIALFWTNPRMPLVSNVEEVRQILFEALSAGELQLATAEGKPALVPGRVSEIPIGSTTIRVRFPEAELPKERIPSIVPPEKQLVSLPPSPIPSHILASPGSPISSPSPTPIPTIEQVDRSSPIGKRAQLWMKAQSDLSDEAKIQKVVAILRRVANIADDGNFENITITLELVGHKERLNQVFDLGKRVEGTQPRLDDLPD